MGANELQQSLLESMQLLGQKAADSTNAAITIKGEIVEEIDRGLRQYSVSYGGAIYKDAYALGEVSYPSSTVVYILIPDGNFDNPKIILKEASVSATNYTTEEEKDIYLPITDNLFGTEGSIDLKSWEDETQTLSLDTNNIGIVFQDYLKTYRTFVFSARVKTEIDKDHQIKGNYGLILHLPFNQLGSDGATNKIYKTYIMDVSTMQGNPYAFNEYSKQDFYFTIDDTLEYDKDRDPIMEAFVKDFGYTEPRLDIPFDIHIKNISVRMVDVLSETESTGYYLAIVPTEGNYFFDGKYANKKTLSPVLKINSKTTSTKDWDCYWFVEDSSIDITSNGYSTIGGLGWKCLNNRTDITTDSEGHETFQYVTTKQTYEVQVSDVTSALRYKCVVVKDDKMVSGIVCLKNLKSNIKITLFSATGKATYPENIGNVRLIAKIYYPGVTDVPSSAISLSTVWQRFDKDNDYIDNNFYEIIRWNDRVDDCFETEISYSTSILEKLNTVNCTFYSTIVENKTITQNNLGTASIIVTTSKDFTYDVTIDNGDVLYKYDADGDSPMVANYDGPASSKIKTIKPFSFRIFKPDGSELNETEYPYAHYKWIFPKNSMMKLAAGEEPTSYNDDYYYIEGYGNKSINYTILPTYNKKKSDNTILLQVEIDGNQISDSKNPKFLKDGEGGTNGSKYAALLTYQGYAYGERDEHGVIRKLQIIYIPEQGWNIYDNETKSLIPFDENNKPHLTPIVYQDGEEINSGYTVSWEMFDSLSTDTCFNVNGGDIGIRKNWTDATAVFCNTIVCAITITEESKTGSQEVIYAYYPIEITRLKNLDMANNIIPSLDGGFEEVIYASDGTNPQYDNTNDFNCIDSIYNESNDYYTYKWYSSKNLGGLNGIDGDGSSKKIKPVTKFDNGNSKNFVKVILTLTQEKKTEISNIITALTNDIIKTQDKRIFYQNNRRWLLDFLENFRYNFYEEKINNAKKVLEYRYELINYIYKLKEVLEEINNLCNKKKIITQDFNFLGDKYKSYLASLNSAYKYLYLLGSSSSYKLGDIKNLNIILSANKNTISSKYGMSTYQELNSYIVSWNSLITQYQKVYIKIIEQVNGKYILQDEYDNLAAFDTAIKGFVNDTNLNKLATEHDNNDPEPEFVQLKAKLSALYSQIINSTDGKIISYSAFVEDILNQINNSLAIYLDNDYQIKYYNDIDANLKEQLDSLNQQKDNYTKMLLPENDSFIIHIKPIVMLFNRYELGNINGWDGNKLYTGGPNEEYLLAPQVGAGAKKNGRFTGVIMGVKQFNKLNTQQIGLFGYSEGAQSFILNSNDGSATFGLSGEGQILVKPGKNAIIQSGDYGSGSGLMIKFNKEPEIRFGSGNFYVTKDGFMYAKAGGEIAGWKIKNTQLESGSGNNGIIIASNGSIQSRNSNWKIDPDGKATFKDIDAQHGTIAGWEINGSIISKNNTSLDSSNGKITCSNLVASSDGEIGGWTINGSTLTNGQLTLGGGAISLNGGGFTLNSSGLSFKSGGVKITAGSGTELTGNLTKVDSKDLVTYVGDIAADRITAHYIESELAKLENVGVQTLYASGNVYVQNGKPVAKIGDSVRGVIKDSLGGTCTFDLSISI